MPSNENRVPWREPDSPDGARAGQPSPAPLESEEKGGGQARSEAPCVSAQSAVVCVGGSCSVAVRGSPGGSLRQLCEAVIKAHADLELPPARRVTSLTLRLFI